MNHQATTKFLISLGKGNSPYGTKPSGFFSPYLIIELRNFSHLNSVKIFDSAWYSYSLQLRYFLKKNYPQPHCHRKNRTQQTSIVCEFASHRLRDYFVILNSVSISKKITFLKKLFNWILYKGLISLHFPCLFCSVPFS